MIVDSISVDKKRVIIKCGDSEVSINMDTYLGFGFDVGDDINLEQVLLESDKQDALSKSLGFVSRKMLTTHELINKLRKLEYDIEVINFCVKKLTEYDYINDYKYAVMYADSKKGTKGTMYIYNKLREKGIAKAVINSINIEEDIHSMVDILIKKYGEPKQVTYQDRAKMIRFLCSRGFLTNNAIKAVDTYRGKI